MGVGESWQQQWGWVAKDVGAKLSQPHTTAAVTTPHNSRRHANIALHPSLPKQAPIITGTPFATPDACCCCLLMPVVLCLQLSDGFAELTAHTRPAHEPKDELNLVYVALTRAMLGLVCNCTVATGTWHAC